MRMGPPSVSRYPERQAGGGWYPNVFATRENALDGIKRNTQEQLNVNCHRYVCEGHCFDLSFVVVVFCFSVGMW